MDGYNSDGGVKRGKEVRERRRWVACKKKTERASKVCTHLSCKTPPMNQNKIQHQDVAFSALEV